MNSLRTANAMIALRVFAMLLVVLAHSAMCYTEIKFRTVAWPLHDHTGHCFFDLFCYGVNGMAMPLFFFLAGGSAAYAYRAQGQWKFLWQRLRRLLVPCLTGIVLILPVTYIMMGYELLQSEQVTLTELLKFKFKSPEVESNAFGLVHLWFLEYLFLVSLAYCALRCAGERLPQGSRNFVWQRLMAPTLRSPWKPLLLAIPSCAIFLMDADTFVRLDNSFLPDLVRIVHYSWFFLVGAWLTELRDNGNERGIDGRIYLVLAAVVFWPMSWLLSRHLQTPVTGAEHILLAIAAATFAWLSLFGIMEFFVRHLNRRSKAVRYVGEASFWLYLCHIPVLVFAFICLAGVSWSPFVKYLLVVAAALLVSLLSYEYLVRYTLIGQLVNGSRKKIPDGLRKHVFAVRGALAAGVLFGGFIGSGNVSHALLNRNFHMVEPGQVYRSARLSAETLGSAIECEELRSVIHVFPYTELSRRCVQLKEICRQRGVQLHCVELDCDRLPSQDRLVQLIDTLDRCPRPLLVHGRWGTSRAAVTAAVAQLLDGAPPEKALEQFDWKYLQFDGPDHCKLAEIVHAYRDWLQRGHRQHSADQFRGWTKVAYQPDRVYQVTERPRRALRLNSHPGVRNAAVE